MDLIEKIEIYRLGALCGIYSKEELVSYLDSMIADLGDVPSEIIEASMLSNKDINDISDKLRELTWKVNDNKDLVNKQLLHTICERYYLKTTSLEDAIYYLHNMIKELNLSEIIIDKIQYLSDALFLAEQDIYGNVDEVRKDFEEFINDYIKIIGGK